MRILTTTALLVALGGASPAFAGANSKPYTSENQVKSVQLSSTWQNGENIVSMGRDGKVNFLYGAAQPTIVCAPLRLCDLELEPNEDVMNVIVGDTARWSFEAARSGPNGIVPHVLIRPTDTALETSLTITTNKRTYHIHLKSSSINYMARVGFSYTAESQLVVDQLRALAPAPKTKFVDRVEYVNTLPNFASAADLDFDYDIDGKASWKPERVFNDGNKIYIDMPEKVKNGEAPTLAVLGNRGDKELVNYRYEDGRYIVDRLFDKAVLLVGAGKSQEKVTIEYGG